MSNEGNGEVFFQMPSILCWNFIEGIQCFIQNSRSEECWLTFLQKIKNFTTISSSWLFDKSNTYYYKLSKAGRYSFSNKLNKTCNGTLMLIKGSLVLWTALHWNMSLSVDLPALCLVGTRCPPSLSQETAGECDLDLHPPLQRWKEANTEDQTKMFRCFGVCFLK